MMETAFIAVSIAAGVASAIAIVYVLLTKPPWKATEIILKIGGKTEVFKVDAEEARRVRAMIQEDIRAGRARTADRDSPLPT
jgi:hypothetical protein